jgi:glycosyltransferase involved in cell wall biosynthesis
MRIAIYHDLPSGGAKRALFEWVRRLIERHEVDVFTSSTADHEFCDIRPFSRNYNVFEFSPRKLFGSPLGRLNQLQRWRDLNSLDRLSRDIAIEINNGAYDVLFAHPSIVTIAPLVLLYTTLPSVYYLHEPFGNKFVHNTRATNLLTPAWKGTLDHYDPLIKLYQNKLGMLRQQSVRKADLLLSNSEFTREHMRVAYGVDATICHVGVDIEVFYKMAGIKQEDFVFSVGELSPRKGFDFVIRSLGKIPSEHRPALKLACNSILPVEKEYIQGLAREQNVDLEILFNLNSDQLRLLYKRAKLCVYAPVMEPFGLVPLEAMACGSAVVGVREGGVMESVVHGYTGLLIERDIDKFGSAILDLLKNPILSAKLGEQGRRHVEENWTWDKSVGELEQHLYRIVQSSLS